MIGTYAAVVAVCAASLALGQATVALCGWRRWSWISPAVGLALLCAVCWGTVRLPGHGAVAAAAVLGLTAAAVAGLWRRVEDGRRAFRAGWPVALVALAAASLPFLVEGHFGILGTGFNPDMSQHLLTADRLAEGHSSQLLRQGYPLGPHSIVVALDEGLGIGLVQGFGGLTVAVAVLASLTALAAFGRLGPIPRTAGALLVALAYAVASYLAQGAFKETMQALFLLAFVLSLREASGSWRDRPLRFVPPALLAVGSVYAYSFPGLIWLAPTAAIWGLAEVARTLGANASPAGGDDGRSSPPGEEGPSETGPAGRPLRPSSAGRPLTSSSVRAALLGLLAFVVLVAPELGRLIEFHSFETFAPHGPGLGNLFGQISPFEALGIWPSGDFRLAPGGGAVPAAAYYAGIAFGLALLAYGVIRLWRKREVAILAGLAAAALAYAAARIGGTPYTAAKAIEIAAPIVALSILLPMLEAAGRLSELMGGKADLRRLVPPLAATAFVAAAGLCSLLALANAPVGPVFYSPALSEMRPLVEKGSTLVVASHELLAQQHGTPYLSWELRGGQVCIATAGELEAPPPGVRFVISEGGRTVPPFPGLRVRRVASPYVLWEATAPVAGKSPCPLIAVRQARQGPAQ